MAERLTEADYHKMLPDVVREGITSEELRTEYNKWAPSYEKDLEKIGYEAFEPTADQLCSLVPADSRAKVRILDIGAGTGLLGAKLQQAGFSHVDALDPASQMLEEAKKQGIYENYIVEHLTEDPLPGIAADSYDVVVGVGVMGYSLVPYTAIHEMIRLTKQGGYVVMSIRESILKYAEFKEMEPTMDRLVREGRWKCVARTVYPNYFNNCNGVLYVNQVL